MITRVFEWTDNARGHCLRNKWLLLTMEGVNTKSKAPRTLL